MAHNRKLAVWAILLHFKDHKPYQGTLGTLEVILIGSRPDLVLQWSLQGQGPYGDHKMDLVIFEEIPGCVYILYIIHSLAP